MRFLVLLILILGGAQAATAQSSPQLKGRLVVEWSSSEQFVYRRDTKNPLRLVTEKGVTIDPKDIYTDGGSIPQIFQNISGLSPWNLGPAYIVHDWIFFNKKCKIGTPAENAMTFEESADALRDAAIVLLKKHFIDPDSEKIAAIHAAVRSPIARRIWDNPPYRCSERPKAQPILLEGTGTMPPGTRPTGEVPGGYDPGPSPTRSVGKGRMIVLDLEYD